MGKTNISSKWYHILSDQEPHCLYKESTLLTWLFVFWFFTVSFNDNKVENMANEFNSVRKQILIYKKTRNDTINNFVSTCMHEGVNLIAHAIYLKVIQKHLPIVIFPRS